MTTELQKAILEELGYREKDPNCCQNCVYFAAKAAGVKA